MEDYKNTGHNGNSRKKEKKGFFARLFGGTGKIGNTSAVNAQASMPESVILRQAGGIPGAGAGKLSAFLATKKGLVLAIVGLTGASVGVSWWLGSAPLMSGNPNVPEFGEKSDYAPYAVRSKMSNGSSIDIISKSGEGLSGIAVNPTAENKEGEGETASAEAVANPADEVKTPEAALPAKENLEEGAKNPLTNVNFGGGGGADVAAKTQIPKAEFSNVMGSVYRPQFAPQFSGKKLTRLSMRARAVKTGDVRRGGRAGAGSTRKALGVMSARVGAAGTTSSSPEMKAAKFEGAWEDKAIAAGGAGLSNIVPGSNSGSGYTPPGGQGGGGGYTPPGGGGGGGDDEEETDCTGKLCSACPGAGCTPDPGETEDKTPWKKHAKAAKAGAIAAVGLIVAATLAGKIPLIG
ncbi:MAG: hypothetical protein NTW04_02350, partial [Elusimicrobia bacterium]|nr:hypothetical protein [Elusimicrobiota bacterium]